MMKQRNQSIDAIKGLAIALVVLGHVFVHNQMEDPYVYDFIKAVQMPLFMIISGYLCGRGRKITDIRSYGKVMGKRMAAYLVPFFTWLTFMHLGNLKEAYTRIFFELDYGLWFLGVLFVLTVMVSTAQLASEWLRKKNTVLSELLFWAVYGGLCLVLVVQIITGNTFLSPYLTIIYVPFYMLGYVFGHYGKWFLCWNEKAPRKLDCRNNRLIQLGSIASGLLFLYLVITRDINSMETRMDVIVQMIASVFGSAAIIYGVLWWKEGKIKNIFAKLGEFTLEIYVIHYHFANMLNFNNKQYDFYTPEGFFFVLASFVAMSAVTFAFIWVMKKVKILNFLFFGRKS